MEFDGRGRPLTRDGIVDACRLLGATEADIWALLAVETRGFGYLRDRRPQILFERHHFRRLTRGEYDSVDDNISNRALGGYAGGAAEYARLEKAMGMNPGAALQSTSWGIGQIMGFNFKSAGYSSVDAMVEGMVKDEDAQLMAVANFIHSEDLAAALSGHDWPHFARRYNGADYRRNSYDTRLAATHAKFSITLPDLTLRLAQVALTYLGYDPGPVDGQRGRRTRSALNQFQTDLGLSETGVLNAETKRRLLERAFRQI